MKIVGFCFCLALVCIGSSSPAAGPDEAVETLKKSISRASQTGVAAEKWQDRKSNLIQEILDLELREAWTRFQLEKTRRYIESEKKNMAVLKKNLARAGKIRDTLTPFLDVLYLDLETHVNTDLPFALEERHRRLAFIRSFLDDPSAGLSDKFGRILEAMQVESEYGYSVDTTRKIVRDIEGEPSQVTLLRVGRLGLFRIFGKNSRVQRFESASKTWEDIDPENAGEINKAMDIAHKKRVSTLVKLPLGGPK